ncbi:MAG: 4Fe-4S dicluster domain-containing protein [Bacillota bacterium]
MTKRGSITIDQRLCKSCGICIEFCPQKVLAAEEPLMKAAVARPEACTACLLCELYCPEWAVNVEEAGDVR